MKPRSWIKTLAVMSPRAALRRTSSSPRTPKAAAAASLMTSIPLPMLTTLSHVVQFLDNNHHEEEGLYSKPGVDVECRELLAFCRRHELPDLNAYSPHSIASVVIKILSDLYKPLIPARVSEQLLEAVSSSRLDDEAEHTITETFKQIRSTTRDFLRVFLCHLSYVSSSGSSRMSVTNLALHVGTALIRPIEDRAILHSKAMIRRRKCVAEFLIRQASSLPYDCATELNIPAITELVAAPSGATKTSAPPSPKQLHFVQVTWDSGEAQFTPEELENMFGKFGEIENLGINDQGNRAIIAYAAATSAEAAESASIPSVRLRRRKPRKSEKRHEYSPEHARSNSSTTVQTDATDAATTERVSTPQDQSDSKVEDGAPTRMPIVKRNEFPNRTDDTIVVEDIEDEPVHDQYENPRPMTDVQTGVDARTTSEVSHDDGTVFLAESTQDADPTLAESKSWPGIEAERQTEQTQPCDLYVSGKSNKFETSEHEKSSAQVQPVKRSSSEEEVLITSRSALGRDSVELAGSTKRGSEVTAVSLPSSPALASDVALANRSTEEQQAAEELRDGRQLEATDDPVTKNTVTVRILPETPRLAPTDTQQDSRLIAVDSNQRELRIGSVQVKSEADERSHSTQAVLADQDTHASAVDAADKAAIEELRSKLVDMEKILSTSTAALSSTNATTEFERAVLQLHKQVLGMVDECLVVAGASPGGTTGQSFASCTSNAEYLDFLEAQAKTQVKILEVEVRAGQELLRLHKTQYEQERVELEEEITALRVGRTETERLCAELRADLRKCRSELACHVANATDIQRQKSALEEKLATVESQLHAKEVALTKGQEQYDKMHRVAAEAQARVERFKLGDYRDAKTCPDNQGSHSGSAHVANVDKRPTNLSVGLGLPHTSKFMTKHGGRANDPRDGDANAIPTEAHPGPPPVSARPSNVAALEAMKYQMARDIQQQIVSTKAALREMEICSSTGKTLEEEEEELRQLQQQLAMRSSDIDEAMNESRSRLVELLSPPASSSSRNAPLDHRDPESNQEPTIFDSTALVNELIARAERGPASTHQRVEDEFRLDERSPRLNRSTGTDLDGAQYHPPAHEAQSVLYKKWTAQRSRKVAQLASYRDKASALLAQQSMKNFQQTLAEMRQQR